ncbi:MAG: carboxylesterase family protein, partial [Terriglobus sp.]
MKYLANPQNPIYHHAMRITHWIALAHLLALPVLAQKTVSTTSGDLIGKSVAPGVRAFLGVPYAAPPLGPLRWKATQPVTRSTTPLSADKIGPACIQKLSRSHAPWTEAFMVQNNTSEDCLTLNIWTAGSLSGHRPVIVYLHGGAFVEGSGGIASYDGTQLSRNGIVVVTVNFRLGIFGYFASSALRAESGHDSAGNYALADQIAALDWVKTNIAAFGGDPARVTLAGQSAGAESVSELLATPRAKGLFQRAIMNSDPFLWPAGTIGSLDEAARLGDEFTAKYGGTLDALRAVSAETLLNATDAPPKKPVIDGYWLPEQPGDDLAHPIGSDVPVMTGWVKDEGFPVTKLSAEAFRADATKKYGDNAERFLKLYPATDDAEAAASQVQAGRDRNIAITTLYADAYQRRRQSAVYLYWFARTPPWKAHPEFGAHHTAEVPYFFETLDQVKDRDYEAADYTVSKLAAGEWVKFATTGKPSASWAPA